MKSNALKKIETIKKILPYFKSHLTNCQLCPRNCRINREKQKGFCKMGDEVIIYTALLHKGEEPALVGDRGSGTVFFSGCNLRCIYCQNYKFSHLLKGKSITTDDLARLFLRLQKSGALNINLVTPTHFLPQILESLLIAFKKGLNIPIVYNSSGYEKKEIIQKLDKIVDIYLVDMKYYSKEASIAGSKTADYPLYNKEVVLEMYKQKSQPLWEGKILKEGLIIRHLILPGLFEESIKVIKWIEENVHLALVSLMSQYRPYFKAEKHPLLGRIISYQEYEKVKSYLENTHLEGWIQEFLPPQDLAGPYLLPLDRVKIL
ncbi:MAG: radical SAM protein [Thermoplasmata archaeon]|nr:MAG: radical SAM protein [Thermoplasmata archaeon]